MVFSSITFLFYFLSIFLAAYFITPTIQARNIVTLLFSLVFYAWGEPRFVIILLISIIFNFCAGLLIDAREGSSRRWALAVAVAGNLLVLGIFKYANFITANLIVLFVIVHVVEVFIAGVGNELGSMITGRYAIRPELRQ